MRILLYVLFVFFSVFHYGQKIEYAKTISRKYPFETKQIIVPSALMLAGTGALLTEKRNVEVQQNKNFLAFGNYVEDYAQFMPHISVYAFELSGIKPKTDFWNRSAIMLKGEALALLSVTGLKYMIKQPRPDGSNTYGFPSGHTVNAFAGATMLSIEYGEQYLWMPYAAYAVAAGVGAMRVVHNKHYWSDVIFGAGLGILSMKVAYWTHQYKWNKRTSDLQAFNVIYEREHLK